MKCFLKKKWKKGLSLLLVLSVVLGMPSAVFSASSTSQSTGIDITKELNATREYMMKTVANPVIASIGGEWAVIGLARSGVEVPQSYYEKYCANVEAELKEKGGELTKVKYTEYSRIILAMTSIGRDVTNVGGYNLLEKLSDFNNVKKQGINGPVFALLAFDSKGYSIPVVEGVSVQTTREMLLDYILEKEVKDASGKAGGFSLTGDVADPDITGMVLQALAKYKDQPRVQAVINRALDALDSIELKNGGFATYGDENSESVIQVIIAKSALGIDPTRNVTALMDYYMAGGSFEHNPSGGTNQMATEQGLYALAAYSRFASGKNTLYDMSDVTIYDNQIKATLNGEYLTFEQAPVNVNGRVLVPMRAIFEAMGAEIQWDATAKKVTGTLGDKTVILVVGGKTATINGVETPLDVPASLVNGSTMVPIRFIGESLDADVNWVKSTKTVTIEN